MGCWSDILLYKFENLLRSYQPDHSTITAKERQWVLIFAISIMLITTLPYALAYSQQGENWRFTGFLFGVEDGNSYIAKMLLGESGEILFRTPYSTAPQRGVLAFLPYLLLGKLVDAPGSHEQLVALYHIFRIVAGILAIMASYDFIALFCKAARFRRMGLILVVLGGGLGWMLVVVGRSQWLGSLPLEFYSPESFGFLALYGIPHLSLARATFLWAFVEYLKGVQPLGKPWYISATRLSGLWLVTAIAQPITAVVLGFVIGMHLLVIAGWRLFVNHRNQQYSWEYWLQSVKLVSAAGLLPALLLVYTTISFATDPFLKMWTEQNIIRSPHPVHYILAYGYILPFAIFGLIQLKRTDRWRGLFLITWISLLPVLAYIPFNLQRRLPEGIWVALVSAGMVALENWAGANHRTRGNTKKLRILPEFILIIAIPSTVILFVGGLFAAFNPTTPIFRDSEEVRAFEFLANQSKPGEVVLSSFDTGNVIPAWAPVRVVIGHGPESVGLSELQQSVHKVFQEETDADARRSFLKEHEVRYLFYGPSEREIGHWEPGGSEHMRLIYQSEHYKIFTIE